MAADLPNPTKYIVYSGGKVQVYIPKSTRSTNTVSGKNRSDVESYLVN